MAEGSDELQPDPELEEVSGGAVKSFLEHLEDLRWTIIKCATAIAIGMALCLGFVPTLTAILKWPLDRAAKRHIMLLSEPTNQVVVLQVGNTYFPPVDLKTNLLGSLDLGTNRFVTVRLIPATNNGLQYLTWQIVPTPEDAMVSGMPKLVFLEPGGSFMAAFYIAFYGGLMLASPFVLYFIGQFLMPALKIKEKKYFMRAFIAGLLLFLGGASFAYFVVMPPALKCAQLYSEYIGVETPYWSFETYMSFVVRFMLGMGAGFELPVVLLALVKIGLLDYEKLSGMRRYMIVGNLVLGAILTTPEVITQLCMAVCLQLLFESAVWIAWYWEWKEKRAAKAAQK